jgi:hypothetical protein
MYSIQGVSDEELLNEIAKEAIDKELNVVKEAKKLKKDYAVITDVTKFKPSSQGGAMEIQKAQKFLLDNGVAKFIRIVESVLGKMQFTKNAKGIGLEVFEVRTYEEAHNYL